MTRVTHTVLEAHRRPWICVCDRTCALCKCKRVSRALQVSEQPFAAFSHGVIPPACGALAGAPFPAHARCTRPPVTLRRLYAYVPRAVLAVELSVASAFISARSDALLVPRVLARHLGSSTASEKTSTAAAIWGAQGAKLDQGWIQRRHQPNHTRCQKQARLDATARDEQCSRSGYSRGARGGPL